MKTKLTLEKRNSVYGYLYILPWLIGIAAFFVYPIIQTAAYSFQEVNKRTLEFSFVGIANFKYAFQGDSNFPKMLVQSVTDMLISTPIILIFSFFVAVLLKKKTKADFILKAIFFLTVILSSDVFLRMQLDTGALNQAQMGGVVADGGGFFLAMDSFSLEKYFPATGISADLLAVVTDAIKNLSGIMIKSGIQIFIFLAALYSVSPTMYEAAEVEGATAWESFWKITLPMVSPMLLVNLVYTVVNSFSSYLNPILGYIYTQGITGLNIGYASALSWIFFASAAVFLGVVFLFARRLVFYHQ